ncbi:MAG: hypothetical protein WCP16_18675 [Pseudanabaena sp. ELA645]
MSDPQKQSQCGTGILPVGKICFPKSVGIIAIVARVNAVLRNLL